MASAITANIAKPPSRTIRNRRALLVGIDRYDDSRLAPLKYCVSDVKALGQVLSSRGFEVTLLHDGLQGDSAPTQKNVEAALDRLAKTSTADDLLLVHFSGHGTLQHDDPTLLFRDTPADLVSFDLDPEAGRIEEELAKLDAEEKELITTLDPDNLVKLDPDNLVKLDLDAKATELDHVTSKLEEVGAKREKLWAKLDAELHVGEVEEEKAPGVTINYLLRGLLAKTAARWVAVFLDACHMGLMGLMGLIQGDDLGPRLAKSGGAFALFSGSTDEQKTQDSDRRQSGVFTSAIIEGLSGAAADPDGSVFFTSLASHVRKDVLAWVESPEGKSKGASQKPQLCLFGGDFPLFPPRK